MQELPPPIQKSALEAYPFYIVCDISQSMWDEGWKSSWGSSDSPWKRMTQELTKLVESMLIDNSSKFREVKHSIHIAVIEFAETANVVLELSQLVSYPDLRRLGQGTWTNYVAAWELLAEIIPQDMERLRSGRYFCYRPTIFFITDGNPGNKTVRQTREDWGVAYQSLSQSLPGLEPRVIAIGIGQSNDSVLLDLHSKNPHGAAIRPKVSGQTSALIQPLIDQIRKSANDLVTKGKFSFPPPAGMHSICTKDHH